MAPWMKRLRRFGLVLPLLALGVVVSTPALAIDPHNEDGSGAELVACWHPGDRFVSHKTSTQDLDSLSEEAVTKLIASGIQMQSGTIFYQGGISNKSYQLAHVMDMRIAYVCNAKKMPVDVRAFVKYRLLTDTAIIPARKGCSLENWTPYQLDEAHRVMFKLLGFSESLDPKTAVCK